MCAFFYWYCLWLKRKLEQTINQTHTHTFTYKYRSGGMKVSCGSPVVVLVQFPISQRALEFRHKTLQYTIFVYIYLVIFICNKSIVAQFFIFLLRSRQQIWFFIVVVVFYVLCLVVDICTLSMSLLFDMVSSTKFANSRERDPAT